MGLSDVQRALANLLTNGALRARFEADPQQVGRELNLSAADIALLMAFSTQEVARCARSLQAKRWLEIEKLLPLSVQTARREHVSLSTLFQQFSHTCVPHGTKRHAQDAIAFAAWAGGQPASAFCGHTDSDLGGVLPRDILQKEIQQQTACAAWLPDLLRYEATWLTVNMDVRSRFCLIRRFRFPVHRMNEILTKQSAASVRAQPVVAVWTRLSPNSRVLFGVLAGRIAGHAIITTKSA